MATITQGADGRPVIAGCGTLPPDDSEPGRVSKESRPKQSKTSKQATADRFGVLNAFVDCSLAGLSKADLITWLCLYRDTRNGFATTAQTDIAKRGGLCVRAVRYAIKNLTKRGLIVRVYKGGINRGPSRYRVEPLNKRTEATRCL